MSLENEKKIVEHLEESVISVLKDFPVAVLSLEKNQKWLEKFPNKIFSSVLGFESDPIKGNLNFCCDRDFLVATVPGFDDTMSLTEQDDQLRDWLGEITNIVAGELLRHIQNYGVRLKIKPPSVFLANTDILDRYEEISPCYYVWFSLNNIRFCLQLGLTLEEGLQLQTQPKSGALKPGEVIQLKAMSGSPTGTAKPMVREAPDAPSAMAKSQTGVNINWTSNGVMLNLNGIKLEIVLNDPALKQQMDEFQLGGHKFVVNRSKDQLELTVDDLKFIFPLSRVA
ncbi:MAG: chemotaxis protein CheX [Oligoflexales bacterium]